MSRKANPVRLRCSRLDNVLFPYGFQLLTGTQNPLDSTSRSRNTLRKTFDRRKNLRIGFHPSIVKCHSIALQGIYLQKLNITLEDRLLEGSKIPKSARLRCKRQLLDAVAYLKSKQISRCDLCPSHCLLSDIRCSIRSLSPYVLPLLPVSDLP